MEWCEHVDLEIAKHYTPSLHWNYCPICGTPRPKEKSLEEELAYYLNDQCNLANNWADICAKGALRFLREKGVVHD